jgi:hypothetical protein
LQSSDHDPFYPSDLFSAAVLGVFGVISKHVRSPFTG